MVVYYNKSYDKIVILPYIFIHIQCTLYIDIYFIHILYSNFGKLAKYLAS